jgi:hypothetical protein
LRGFVNKIQNRQERTEIASQHYLNTLYRIVGVAFLNWRLYTAKKRQSKQYVASLQQSLGKGIAKRACFAWLSFLRERAQQDENKRLLELRRTSRIFRMWYTTMGRNRFERVQSLIIVV